jgi:hypothetical protein
MTLAVFLKTEARLQHYRAIRAGAQLRKKSPTWEPAGRFHQRLSGRAWAASRCRLRFRWNRRGPLFHTHDAQLVRRRSEPYPLHGLTASPISQAPPGVNRTCRNTGPTSLTQAAMLSKPLI